MEKIEKKYQFIFPFFPQAKWTQYENFKVKITIDIKMAILWQCKNHHNRTKYSIVSLQECFRILQFKSGQPVDNFLLHKIFVQILILFLLHIYVIKMRTIP